MQLVGEAGQGIHPSSLASPRIGRPKSQKPGSGGPGWQGSSSLRLITLLSFQRLMTDSTSWITQGPPPSPLACLSALYTLESKITAISHFACHLGAHVRSFWIVGCWWILERQHLFLNNPASFPRREMTCYVEPVSLLPVCDTEMISGGTAALSSPWSLRMKASCFKVAELRDRGVCISGDSSSSCLAPGLQLCPLLVRADILEATIGCVLDYSQIYSLEHQGECAIFNALLCPQGLLG